MDFDTIIIGAGVVGLSIGLECAKKGEDVLVIERNQSFGEETSSRNSEVIHAGIYYETGSYKHKLCIDGKEKLFKYLLNKNIPHEICGKYIVAKKDQEKQLKDVFDQGKKNGVYDLEYISNTNSIDQLKELDIECAIWSPRTGIFDSHAYMVSLIADLESLGGTIVFNTEFIGAKLNKHLSVNTRFNHEETFVTCKKIINSAGIFADKVAKKLPMTKETFIPNITYAKGNYFSYTGKNDFSSLIYPVPDKHSLGIHLTVDQNNQIRFGPDIEFVKEIDYQVNENLKSKFYESFQKFWPNLDIQKLHASYAGIRPKIINKNGKSSDFIFNTYDIDDLKIINLFGIESPGLTSNISIAEMVSSL